MGYICMNTGVKVRSVLLTAVTRKAIYLSKVSVETSADIVNFVANDIGKVYDGLQVRAHTLCSTCTCVAGVGSGSCQHPSFLCCTCKLVCAYSSG